MSKTVRCKFSVESVTSFQWGGQEVKLRAVTDSLNNEENNSFAQATPNGVLEITVDNPAVKGHFMPGDEFYIDMVKVKKD